MLSEDQEHKVAAELRSETWRVSPGWSPLEEATTAALPSARPAWRWSSPGEPKIARLIRQANSIDGTPEKAEAAQLQVLRKLAKGEGVPAWNATVLLARHDRQAALDSTATLEWLVTQQDSPARDALTTVRKWLTDVKPHQETVTTKPLPKSNRPTVPVLLRAAAAEVWCAALAEQGSDLEESLAPAGCALLEHDLPPEVRRELWRSIARHLPPDKIPFLAEGLEPIDPLAAAQASAARDGKRPLLPNKKIGLDDRRAAAEACLIYAVHHPQPDSSKAKPVSAEDTKTGIENPLAENADDAIPVSPWPDSFWDLSRDNDPQLRRSFSLTLAAAHHPQAISVLTSQLTDREQHVRETAILGLGWLGTKEALDELRILMKKEDETVRRFAIRGMGRHGVAHLTNYAKDKSPVIRQEVARQLGKLPGQDAARLLRDLLLDSNLEVQTAAILALPGWPDEQALPLLLESLSQSSLRTRQTALRQLEERKGQRLTFPTEGTPNERASQARELAQQWNVPDQLVRNIEELSTRNNPRARAMRSQEIREQLALVTATGEVINQAAAQSWFQQLVNDDLPVLEEVLNSVPAEQGNFLLAKVLPRLSPAYEGLRLMGDADVNNRRKGAKQLNQIGSQASLSPALVRRMIPRLQGEQDRIVWRCAMQAVTRDASDEAAGLAELAIHSPWPDIRILGCEFVASHGRPQQAAWVIPLFSDENKSVQRAAVTAAGRCRNPLALDGGRLGNNPAPVPGLRRLLHESQGELRYQTVVSMAELGDAEAQQELIRLSYDSNPTNRLEVVKAMGQTGQTRFIEPLIRQAWTEQNPNVRQATVASLEKLVPPEDRPTPPNPRESMNLQQTIENWARWWEDRVAGKTPAGTAPQDRLTRR